MDDDIEIKEVESYTSGGKGGTYNYSTLVMDALKKCEDTSSEEMRKGYWNSKRDKLGNYVSVWNPDAREKFFESIETLKMVVSRDFDDEVIEDLGKIDEELNTLFISYCELEKKWWENLHGMIKKKKREAGFVFMEGRLSVDSFYYDEFLNDKVKIMRKVFEKISALLKKNGDYKEEMFEA